MTAKPVIPRALAKSDIQVALDHYLTEAGDRVALGFIDDLQRAFKHIARYPESVSARYAQELDLPGLRAWPLKRYPYIVFYIVAENHIDVWRVLHADRDIPGWMTGKS